VPRVAQAVEGADHGPVMAQGSAGSGARPVTRPRMGAIGESTAVTVERPGYLPAAEAEAGAPEDSSG